MEWLKKNLGTPNLIFVLLPQVKGKIFKSSRQYYTFAWQNWGATLVDILHFLHPRMYPFFWVFPAGRFISTFHGGADVIAQRNHFVFSREIYNRVARTGWQKLAKIVAVSRLAKEEIVQNYKVAEDWIAVIPPGTDRLWGVEEKPNRTISRLDRNFILIVGRWQPHKNLVYALNEWTEIRREVRMQVECVVLCGQLDHDFDTRRIIKSFEAEGVHFFGQVPDTEYRWFLKKANCVVFPSLNEGFGIPAFEAVGEGNFIFVHRFTPICFFIDDEIMLQEVDMSRKGDLSSKLELYLSRSTIAKNSHGKEFLRKNGLTWKSTVDAHRMLYTEVMSKMVMLNDK